jgi:hypothetical protein
MTGCATLPTSSAVQQETVSSPKQGQNNPVLIPVPPSPDETPKQIVQGFLHASASFANNHQVAREYLTKDLQWTPSTAATVVSSVTLAGLPPRRIPPGNPRGNELTIVLHAQRLARLTRSGQYLQSSRPQTFSFGLTEKANQWRISKLPQSRELILQKEDFERIYLARNLYFYSSTSLSGQTGTGPRNVHRLVPDPIYVPEQGPNTTSEQAPALSMVTALRAAPSVGPLAGSGATTAFPPDTNVLGVQVTGTLAIVDLGGQAADAGTQELTEIAAQIAWTLTASSYSPSAIRSVELQVNHVTRRKLLLGTDFAAMAPAVPVGQLYYLAGNGVWRYADGQPRQEPWLTDDGPPGVTQIAVQPVPPGVTPQIAGLVPERHGCVVYTGLASRKSGVRSQHLAGACSSLSFDSQGNVWVAAGSSAWMLPGGSNAFQVVVRGLPPDESVIGLRVAPDDTRMAVLGRDGQGQVHLWLGAMQNEQNEQSVSPRPGSSHAIYIGQSGSMLQIGADVPDPQSLAWYDPDHLMVLSGGGSSQLYEVPVNGGSSTKIQTPTGAVWLAATGPGQQNGAPALAVATNSGWILVSPGPTANGAAQWTPPDKKASPKGRAPAFPG